MLSVCVPSVPVVVEYIVLQFVPSGVVWIWKAVAYALSQYRTTLLMVCVAPRSTSSHCGSLNALDQRVLRLPSTAFDAGYPAPSSDDAVAGWPWDSSVPDPAVGVAWASFALADVPAELLAVSLE